MAGTSSRAALLPRSAYRACAAPPATATTATSSAPPSCRITTNPQSSGWRREAPPGMGLRCRWRVGRACTLWLVQPVKLLPQYTSDSRWLLAVSAGLAQSICEAIVPGSPEAASREDRLGSSPRERPAQPPWSTRAPSRQVASENRSSSRWTACSKGVLSWMSCFRYSTMASYLSMA